MAEKLKVKISVDNEEFIKKMDDSEKSVKKFSKISKKKMKEFDKMLEEAKDVAKDFAKKMGVAMGAAAASMVALTEGSREMRDNQAKLATAFGDSAEGAEMATKAYDDLYRVLGDDGQTTEAAAHLAKLTNNQQDLSEWTNICKGVYATFGDSLPIEALTEAANETSETGELTGALADALNWAGITEDDFTKKIQNCTSKQQREKLIRDTLNGLYKTAAERYEKTGKKILDANNAQNKLNKQMQKAGDSVEPVVNGFKNVGATILEKMQKPLEKASKFITEGVIPKLEDTVEFISKHFPEIAASIAGVTTAVVAYKAASKAAELADKGWTIATLAQAAAQKILNGVMALTPWGWIALLAGAGLTALGTYAIFADDAAEEIAALSEEQQELCDKINETNKQLNDQRVELENQSNQIAGMGDKHKEYVEELDSIVDANGRVKEGEEARANFILGELNNAYNKEYEIVDGLIENYDEFKDTIYDVIEAKTAQAMLEAHNDVYIQAIENEAAAYDEMLKASDAVTEQKKKEKEAQEALAKARDDYYEAQRAGDYSMYWTNAWTEKQKVFEAEQAKLEELKSAYDLSVENYASYVNTIATYEEASVAAQEGNTQKVKDLYSSKSTYIADFVSDLDTETQKTIDILYQEAVNAGIEAQRIKDNFENGVDGYTEEMVKEAEKGYNDALWVFNTAYADSKAVGGNMGEGLKDGIVTKEKIVAAEGKNILEKAINAMREAADSHSPSRRTISLGEDLGEGLKNGMDNKKSSIFSKARSLVSGLLAEMRKEADSHSPSRKTMALGFDLDKGTEIGITKATDDVVKAAQKMIDKTIYPIQASIGAYTPTNFFRAVSTPNIPIAARDSQTETNKELISALSSVISSSNQPIILQVDGKTFGQIACSSINNLTRQTGNLPLILA